MKTPVCQQVNGNKRAEPNHLSAATKPGHETGVGPLCERGHVATPRVWSGDVRKKLKRNTKSV